jgi:hypothetical protein
MISTSLKPTPSSAPTKRRLASDLLSDDFDSENIDQGTLNLPSKRAKGLEGTPTKVSKFTLHTTPNTDPTSFKFTSSLSVSMPPPSTAMPIAHSRGSPTKPRRIAQLGSKRRLSTPIRRINPPGSAKSALPFSIDAALSGTLSTYTPSSLSNVTTNIATPPKKPKKAAPSSWFFDIHEDTPDQEATNLFLHDAASLDISSDDDAMSARAKDKAQRGKENVPPPEYVGAMSRARNAVPRVETAMEEDRAALRDLDVKAFWPEGKEEVVVLEDEENVEIVEKVVKKEVEVKVCVDDTAS